MKKTSGGGGGECDAGEKTDCHVAALLAMTGFLRGAVRVGRGVGDAAPYAEQEVRCAEVYGWPHR